MGRTRLCLALFGVCAGAHATILWDTGAPHYVAFNGNNNYVGFTSGNLGAGLEQRWAAMPFRIGIGGAVIQEVDVDGFNDVNPDRSPATLDYIIWHRTALIR